METMPIIVYESSMARSERTIKRLFIIVILLIVLLVGTNVAWLIYESQFEDVVTTNEIAQDVDTENGTAYVAGVGGVTIGESSPNS